MGLVTTQGNTDEFLEILEFEQNFSESQDGRLGIYGDGRVGTKAGELDQVPKFTKGYL